MTTIVKPKKLSEIRREEKQRKMAIKAKKVSKMKAQQAEHAALKKTAKMGMEDYIKSLGDIKAPKRPDAELPFEEYFVREVGMVDKSLSEIADAILHMEDLRNALNWDSIKGQFDEAVRDGLEKSILMIEEINKPFSDSIRACCIGATEALEQLKFNPTREALDVFTTKTSSDAFVIFTEWNEVVIEKFIEVHEQIEAIDLGEKQ